MNSFTRTEIAKWYGLTESGLRKRLAERHTRITNRVLTLSDVEHIIATLGKPPYLPPDIKFS